MDHVMLTALVNERRATLLHDGEQVRRARRARRARRDHEVPQAPPVATG